MTGGGELLQFFQDRSIRATQLLRERVGNRVTLHQWQWAALAVGNELVRVDAEQVVHCREQILRADRPVGNVAGMFVRSADDVPALDSRAGDQRRVHARPVIATATLAGG